MTLLGGWLCKVIYQSGPYSPLLLKSYFTPIKGAGGMAPCALSYASDGGACSQDLSTGGGGGASFPLPR